jgi:hypothetical protein
VRRILILFLFLQAYHISLANNKPRIQPEPAWVIPVNPESGRVPDLKDVSNGYYYDLMNRQVNLVNHTAYFRFIRHIVNESGVQEASEVSVNFAPQFQQLIFHKVMIIRGGISINQLQTASIKLVDDESGASDFQYNGIKRAYLILKDVQKGDLVDFSYSIIGFNPVFNGRYSAEYYFDSPTPVANYYLSFLAEPGRKLYIKSYNHAPAPTEQELDGMKLYQWKNPGLHIGSSDINIPSWYTSDPYISVTEYASWKEVVDWGLTIFKNEDLKLPPALLHQMDLWRKEANGDPDMFANLALRFVQDQIRYLGLEIGSYTHQPHSPETVYNLRFGDCKDKSLLLTNILNHEHIAAFVALTNTEERENLSQATPSATAFNHAIVAIKRSSGYIFVDPTISLQRGELINSYIPAYAWALVLKEGENQLAPVEPGFLHYASVTENLDVHFADSSSLKVTTEYKGGAADDTRNNLSTLSRKEISDGYLKYYSKLFDGILVDAPVLSSDDSLQNKITVNESYVIPSLWHKNDAGKLTFDVTARLIALKIPDPAAHPETEPLALYFPCSEEYTMNLNMPEDWPVDMNGVHIKNDSYQFDFTPALNGKHISLKYFFKSFRDFIPAEEVRQYKADYKEMDKCLSYRFSWNDLTVPAPGTKGNPHPATNINWITIWLSFFFGVLFTILFSYLNKNSKTIDQRGDAGLPLGGWIVFLGITLMIRFAMQGYNFWIEHYYLKTTWIQLEQAGGMKLRSLFIFQMFLSLFSMAGIGALLYWFFGRRDIFPPMFIYYTAIFVIAHLILLIIYHTISLPFNMTTLKEDATTQFYRMFIYAAIWISFVIRSEKVKQTFVYPHG